jgi:hypothetical protein
VLGSGVVSWNGEIAWRGGQEAAGQGRRIERGGELAIWIVRGSLVFRFFPRRWTRDGKAREFWRVRVGRTDESRLFDQRIWTVKI